MELSPDPEDYILQAPISHPVLPYITTIFGSLAPGKMVSVEGMIPVEAERFQVDFQVGCSKTPRADIGIHFNPRFRSRPHVICNSLNNGHWMEERRFPNLPLKGGDCFHLLFLFEQDHVKVSVNGHHYLQYPFNLPLARMNTFGMSGDVVVKMVAFLPNNPFDTSRTGYPDAPHLFMKHADLNVPLSCLLPDGLRPGDSITVQGLVHQDPKEFCVKLKKDPSHMPLCFHVCFVDRTVSWSSVLDKGQDSGVRVAKGFPFHPQRYFELLFLCKEDHLKLALNGTPLGQQHSPQPVASPTMELTIDGDVTLYGVLASSS